MHTPTEVRVHGTLVDGFTLLECTACGPVAVTTAHLKDAMLDHINDHTSQGANA